MEAFEFDLPTSLLEAEKAHLMHNRLLALKRENLSEELMNSRKEEIEAEVEKEANEDIRMTFLTQKISGQFDLNITGEELQMELQKQMYMVPEGERIIDMQRMEPEEVRQRLIQHMIKDRVKEHLAVALTKEGEKSKKA